MTTQQGGQQDQQYNKPTGQRCNTVKQITHPSTQITSHREEGRHTWQWTKLCSVKPAAVCSLSQEPDVHSESQATPLHQHTVQITDHADECATLAACCPAAITLVSKTRLPFWRTHDRMTRQLELCKMSRIGVEGGGAIMYHNPNKDGPACGDRVCA